MVTGPASRCTARPTLGIPALSCFLTEQAERVRHQTRCRGVSVIINTCTMQQSSTCKASQS
eukprot:4898938-Alexandrium_andersonii.AAC.1